MKVSSFLYKKIEIGIQIKIQRITFKVSKEIIENNKVSTTSCLKN
jgi:hypothetical protein